MKRDPFGTYEETTTLGEAVRASVSRLEAVTHRDADPGLRLRLAGKVL